MALNGFPFSCDLGRVVDHQEVLRKADASFATTVRINDNPFRLTEDQWSTHIAVIGPTGAGKSRALWQMMREHRRQRRGFATFDTGDLANDFLADCAEEIIRTGNHGLLKKLHHVQLNPYHLPRYNLWGSPPELRHPDFRDFAMLCWRHARVQSRIRIFQAKATGSTDFTVQVRAHRVMTNVFTVLATSVEGRRLAAEDAFIFFDPSHKFWRRVVDRIAPLLPPEVRQDIELLGGFKRLDDIRKECEASINRCRSVLGPCLKAMLTDTGKEPSLDLKSIVRRGDYLIVDVPQTDWASQDENTALASMLALDLVETTLNAKREHREKFTLFSDETPELLAPLGREIGRWLRVCRKYGLACVLSFQDLSSMRRDDFDLAPTVLSQCGTIICFRSRWPDDADILARILLSGNLEFVPLMHEIERQGGYEWLTIDEYSESVKRDKSRSRSNGTTKANTVGSADTTAEAEQKNWGNNTSKNKTTDPRGVPTNRGESAGSSNGGAATNSAAHSNNVSQTEGSSHSESEGETEGWSVSVNHKIMPLPIVVREAVATGKLENAIGDQTEKNRQRLHGLEQRHAVIIAPGMKKAVEVETAEVGDPFASAVAQAKAVDWIVRELVATHPYYFTPEVSADEQERRVLDFLGTQSADDLASLYESDESLVENAVAEETIKRKKTPPSPYGN